LYDFKIDKLPQPYTIVFVANPFILKRMKPIGEDVSEDDLKKAIEAHRNNPDNYELDPIIRDPDLFYYSVDRALRSFENDEVLGNSEIWSRVRIITMFDKELSSKANEANKHALLEEFQGNLRIDGETPLNLIDPLPDMNKKVECLLFNNQDGTAKLSIENGDIDVIFGMSASPTHDRSTAHFSDYDENTGRVRSLAEKGAKFTCNPDPHKNKKDEAENLVVNVEENFPLNGDDSRERTFYHEYHVSEPGRVALNVIGAIQRTFIHEFAHAMSSMINGAITDEYADVFDLESPSFRVTAVNTKPPFYVNRIERKKLKTNGKFIGVHKVFADYNCVVFHSDLEHPSAEENWLGYFPQPYGTDVACIMDRFTDFYHFDNVLSCFMYDRLVAKLNRPKK